LVSAKDNIQEFMKEFFKWLGSVVEDKRGQVSSKRIGFFWCLFMLQRASINPDANEIAIYTIAGLCFGLVGLTIPEWFSKIKDENNK
jgi:aspartate/tyrosine/aromatic aminotransferase